MQCCQGSPCKKVVSHPGSLLLLLHAGLVALLIHCKPLLLSHQLQAATSLPSGCILFNGAALASCQLRANSKQSGGTHAAMQWRSKRRLKCFRRLPDQRTAHTAHLSRCAVHKHCPRANQAKKVRYQHSGQSESHKVLHPKTHPKTKITMASRTLRLSTQLGLSQHIVMLDC